MTRSGARAFAVAVVLPLVIGVGATLVLRLGPGVPEEFVVPTGLDDRPATAGDAALLVLMTAVVAAVVGGTYLLLGHRSAPGRARVAGAFGVGLTCAAVALVLAGAWTQQDAVGASWQLAVTSTWAGVAAGGVLGALLAGTVPSSTLRADRPVPDDAVRVALAPGETQVRTGWVRCRWWVYALELLVLLPVLLMWLPSGTGPWGLLPVYLAPVLVTVLAGTTFRSVIGENGLVLTSLPLGVPRIHVPLDQVVRADVVTLSPWSTGWGYRPTTVGAVVTTRKGIALQVERGDGSLLAFSMDDAHEAAALLNTLADRRRSAPVPA